MQKIVFEIFFQQNSQQHASFNLSQGGSPLILYTHERIINIGIPNTNDTPKYIKPIITFSS